MVAVQPSKGAIPPGKNELVCAVYFIKFSMFPQIAPLPGVSEITFFLISPRAIFFQAQTKATKRKPHQETKKPLARYAFSGFLLVEPLIVSDKNRYRVKTSLKTKKNYLSNVTTSLSV